MSRRYYDVLEVSPKARPAVIHAAHRAIVKDVHPNAPGGSEKLLLALNEAYAVLSDETKRADYDRNGDVRVAKGTVVGNYRFIGRIAEGGFGTTYLAEHLVAGEKVCIKHCHQVSAILDQILIEEAKAIWDLRHYSLPVMRDFLRMDDGSLALVMSYVPGENIEQIVQSTGRMDPEDVAWIVERALNALMYLHYHGVIHGDIKPSNIIVQKETHQVVLVDFGLSAVKPSHDSTPKGYTVEFAPPEQLQRLNLVPQSDLYSLGLTMLYALGGSLEAVKRMEVPTDVPEPLCAFMKRLLVRSVMGRPIWQKENLCKTIVQVRQDSFGRTSSGMSPNPGL